MHKKRVLFLFAHLHKGGMQKAVSNITRAIGGDLELFVAYYGTESPGFEYNAIEHNFNISGSKEMGLLSKVINFKNRLSVLRDYVRTNKIDVVVSFGETASVINLLSKHSARKYISIRVALKESLDGGLYGRIYKFLIKMLYPKADLIIPVSKALAEEVDQFTKGKVPIKVIHNLYFTKELIKRAEQPFPREYQYLQNKPYIVNVGSYCHQKGQDLLIEAFVNIQACKQGTLLVLVGRGPDETALKEQAQKLGIGQQVIFTGFQSNPYPFIKHAKLFVLSSRYEGFPNVLVEAMIVGTPVIAFDCPTGPSEILVDKLNKYLIPLENTNQLTEKIDLYFNGFKSDTLKVRGLDFDYRVIEAEWLAILKA